jgi:PKD repeat protein
MERKVIFISAFCTVLLFLLSLLSFVSAEVGNPALVVYDVGPSQLLNGYFNVSLNESSGNSISISVDGKAKSFTLLELMQNAKSYGIESSCYFDNKTVACKKYYEEKTSADSFSGGAGEALVGFALNNITEIISLSFGIEGSGVGEECNKIPFSLDLFDDGVTDFEYIKAPELESLCDEQVWPKGYDESKKLEEIVLDTEKCEVIDFPYKTGKVMLGAKIKYATEGNGVAFRIILPQGEKKCNNTEDIPTDYQQVVSCDVEAFVKEGNYTVCIKPINTSDKIYLAKHEKYGLFMQAYKISQLGETITFNSTFYKEQTGKNLKDDINAYLNSFYGNCSAECIIPIKIVSTANYTISSISLQYKRGSDTIEMSSISTLSYSYPRIVSGFVAIPLAAFNLTAPSTYGNYTVSINYAGKTYTKSFKVEKVPIVAGVYPLNIMLNEPTEIRVIAFSPAGRNITSYKINFGDGSQEENTNGIFVHTYSTAGTYTITAEVTDSAGFKGIASFTATVGVFKETLNASITKAIQDISSFEAKLGNEFYAAWLKDKLNTSGIKTKLQALLSSLSTANETQLASIKSEYDGIKARVASNILAYENFSMANYLVDWNKVDKQAAESAAGSCALSDNECKKAIAAWNYQNLEFSLTAEKKKIVLSSGSTETLTILNLNVNNKRQVNGALIVGLDYSLATSTQAINSSSGKIKLPLQSARIAYLGDVDILNLAIFAVPTNLNKLQPTYVEITGVVEKKKSIGPKILLILAIILLVVGLIVIWHKQILDAIKTFKKKQEEKKEKKLFATRADYYNLISFISNSLKSGMSKEEITRKLSASGWKAEQIKYGMKKVEAMMKGKEKGEKAKA